MSWAASVASAVRCCPRGRYPTRSRPRTAQCSIETRTGSPPKHAGKLACEADRRKRADPEETACARTPFPRVDGPAISLGDTAGGRPTPPPQTSRRPDPPARAPRVSDPAVQRAAWMRRRLNTIAAPRIVISVICHGRPASSLAHRLHHGARRRPTPRRRCATAPSPHRPGGTPSAPSIASQPMRRHRARRLPISSTFSYASAYPLPESTWLRPRPSASIPTPVRRLPS